MAYAAQYGKLVPVAWVLMIANMFWAIAYDTEYAMVDRDDDRRLGLKSSAILLGRYDVTGVMACHALFLRHDGRSSARGSSWGRSTTSGILVAAGARAATSTG